MEQKRTSSLRSKLACRKFYVEKLENNPDFGRLRVAVVHYWLVTYRGGEKVLREMIRCFPRADIFTLILDNKLVRKHFPKSNVYPSLLNKLPFAKRYHQVLLPLMPYALEQFDLSDYDLVISLEAGPAKGVITNPEALHICYCHSPMRYIWDMKDVYLNGMGCLKRGLFRVVSHYMRIWDRLSADRVDHFIVNSHFVEQRIQKFYRRDCEVIHPPIELERYRHDEDHGYYFLVSQLVAYKRVDLAVRAFNELGYKLIISGVGPEEKRLKALANRNVEFTGHVSDEKLIQLYSHCRSFLMPGKEDFGLTPLEANASGKPVIAYNGGGILDTMKPETAILFDSQEVPSLTAAVRQMENRINDFSPKILRENAERFTPQAFRANFLKTLQHLYSQRR